MQENTSEQTTDSAVYLCVPGESLACGCENGLDGAQTCQGDGQSFGDCVCEEPETTGDMSTSGSEQECTPGEIDACACDLETIGIHICKDNNTWGSCVCQPEQDDSDPPQFILRNSNDNIVNAIFTPLCTGDNYALCNSSVDETSFPCAYIKYLDGAPVWLAFDIASGKPQSCYPNNPSWYDVSYEVVFDNDACEGTPLALHGFGLRPNLDIVRVENKIYWANANKNAFTLKNSYQYAGGNCFSIGSSQVFKIEEVPIIITELLSSAPYSIHIE